VKAVVHIINSSRKEISSNPLIYNDIALKGNKYLLLPPQPGGNNQQEFLPPLIGILTA
jgi:hypothetical protein